MRVSFLFLGLVVLGLVTACSNGDSGFGSIGVTKTFDAEVKALQSGDTQRAYLLLSPSMRSSCQYQYFASSHNAPSIYSEMKIKNFKVKVLDDTAFLTYLIMLDGDTIDVADSRDPDVFILEDGKWYDEADSHTTC